MSKTADAEILAVQRALPPDAQERYFNGLATADEVDAVLREFAVMIDEARPLAAVLDDDGEGESWQSSVNPEPIL
jgi:hypothetical protein